LRAPLFNRPEASEGSKGESVRSSRQSCRAFSAQRASAAWQPLVPKPATCRQARSRRRPDDREVVRRLPRKKASKTPFSRRISKRNDGGFSHGVRRAVSEERVFTAGAREQTSVVETDSKHPGGASKEGREAPRGAHRQATGRREARTGPIVILFAQGCNGSQWPQGQGEPSILTSYE